MRSNFSLRITLPLFLLALGAFSFLQASELEDSFSKILARKALEAEDGSVSSALQTLKFKGFYPEILAAVAEAEDLADRDPRLTQGHRRIKKALTQWFQRYPYRGDAVYDTYRIITRDWQPGKYTARVRVVLQLRHTHSNTYSQLEGTVSLDSRTWDVTDFDLDPR